MGNCRGESWGNKTGEGKNDDSAYVRSRRMTAESDGNFFCCDSARQFGEADRSREQVRSDALCRSTSNGTFLRISASFGNVFSLLPPSKKTAIMRSSRAEEKADGCDRIIRPQLISDPPSERFQFAGGNNCLLMLLHTPLEGRTAVTASAFCSLPIKVSGRY